MADLAYLAFVFAFSILGALLGIAAHYWRANAALVPEELGLGEPLDTLSRDDYQWEKHVVGAEWDDAGYWDSGSVRNLVYYMASGAFAPLLAGFAFWDRRMEILTFICKALASIGLQSPLCY